LDSRFTAIDAAPGNAASTCLSRAGQSTFVDSRGCLMSYVTIQGRARLLAPVVLLPALAACSGKDETAAPAASTGAAAPAANPAPAAADQAKVQTMDTAQLRDSASTALRENRMYAPAGDNAMEYYLALRDKLPDDASIKNALTDLQPYTLIAAEQ